MTWQTHRVYSFESAMADLGNPAVPSSTAEYTGTYGASILSGGTILDITLPEFTSLRIGYWARIDRFVNDTKLFRFVDDDNIVESGSVRVRVDYDIVGLRDTSPDDLTAKYTSSTRLYRGQYRWVHLGLHVCKSPARTSFYIDGVLTLTLAYVIGDQRVQIPTSTSTGHYNFQLDDCYVQISSESETDITPPPYRFYPVRADYHVQQEWSKFPESLVDNEDAFEVPNNGDTSYVESSVNGQRDLYEFAVLPFEVPYGYTTKLATVQAIAKRIDGAAIKMVAQSGVNELVSPEIELSPSYNVYQHTFDTAPDGTEFTNAKFSDTNFGIEGTGI